MGEGKDNHMVEIPVEQENSGSGGTISIWAANAIQHHPMMEISRSPGHVLPLKLWQREEHLFSRRIIIQETRLDMIRRDIFQLCCFFFLFHGLFTTILFMSSAENDTGKVQTRCTKWWVPSFLSVGTSLAIAEIAHMKLNRYWKAAGRLQRETGENRALTRCIQELRIKGTSFDLSKDPQMNNNKRMKSSSIEIRWKPITCCTHYLVTLCLVVFAGLVFPAPKLFLCIF